MSRGPGKVQRRVLDLFAAKPDWMPDSIELAARVFDKNPISDSEHVSVRRALRALVQSGVVVDMGRHWHDNRKRWCLPAKARAYHARVEQAFGRGHQ